MKKKSTVNRERLLIGAAFWPAEINRVIEKNNLQCGVCRAAESVVTVEQSRTDQK